MQEGLDHCPECGLAIQGGPAACRGLMDDLLARDFGNALFFRIHRLMVDTYCLQHPARYCASAKSLAAHLTGLAWLLEQGGDPALGNEALRRWLDGNPGLSKPELPTFRGRLTIRDVSGFTDPAAYAAAVRRWAESTWEAYAPLHPQARAWIAEATAPDHPDRRVT